MPLFILTRLANPVVQWLRGAGLGLALLALAACTPQAAAILSVLPDGTVPVLLSHLEGMEEGNRKRVADLEARRDWDGLAKLAEDNLSRDRNNSDWWTVAGYAHSQAGRHPRAIQCYSEVVRLAPDEMLGWNLLAQSYRAAKQPARAVQTLNNALRVRTDAAETWYLLGESYSDLDRDAPAASAYHAALQLNGQFARAWFGLGRAYARLGRGAEFEQSLQSLQKLDPALAKELAALRPAPR
ncbi:MAG: tetratricopeptide repeat protein [Burkholderiales bacterium]